MAIFVILRAVFGYLFLVLMVRIVGRRPGKQLTPFEFVLVFYLGGLTLTGMVGEEASLVNAVTQIITVALCHYALAVVRYRSSRLTRLLDGVPLILLEKKRWRTETLSRMRLQDDDVMDMAREQGIQDLDGIETATLEAYGEISIIPAEEQIVMPTLPFSSAVEDTVPKVDGSVAVGEDLDFQRKWWRFESAIWWFFLLILVCDLLGLFGRGYLAKATRTTSDQTLKLDYERIERAGTPSIMTLHFGQAAIHDGHLQVFVSQSVVKTLGAQRISPQPMLSTLGEQGITYTFAADGPATVEIALSPSFPGRHHFTMQVPGGDPIQASVVVLP